MPCTVLALVGVSRLATGCDRSERSRADLPPGPSASAPAPPSAPSLPSAATSAHGQADAGEVPVETIPVPGDLPAFLVRGSAGDARIVYLHGMCGHGLEPLRAFAGAVARKGTAIAVQADKVCEEGTGRRWTNTPDALNARIQAAFRAAGDESDLLDMVVIGNSEGAVLAEMLAHHQPRRYSRVILIGAPRAPTEYRLRHARSTVMIAGEIDRQDLASSGARDLRNAGIPSTFLVLPKAKHGALGPDAAKVMAEALDWLWANQRTLPDAGET